MELNDIALSNGGLPTTARQTEDSLATAASDFETFLTLLTSQLRNQDPLSPIDSTQFVEQLASFSAVEQQIETNSKLDTLAESLAVSGLEGATRWIGKQVETASGAARFQGEALNFVIPENNIGDSSEIVISDQSGNVVYREAIDNQRRQFSWGGEDSDGGVVPDGDYVVSINRIADNEVVEVSSPLAITKVLEARLENSAVKLVLSNGGIVDPQAIIAVRDAQTLIESEEAS